MADARISTGLPAHPKTKKLIRRLGERAAWYLVRLFLWAAENKPDGNLSGMADFDIELAIDWPDDSVSFIGELVAVKFIDGEEGSRSIHDWTVHNPWAAGSEARSEKSRFAALCKQYGRAEASRQMPEYAARLAGSLKPQAPGMPASSPGDRVDVPNDASGKPVAVPDSASGTPIAELGSAPSPSPLPIPSPIPYPSPAPSGKECAPAPAPETLTPGAACKAMRIAGLPDVNPSHPTLKALIEAGITLDELIDAARKAAEDRKPFAYALAVAEGRRREAAEMAPLPSAPPPRPKSARQAHRETWAEAFNKPNPQGASHGAGDDRTIDAQTRVVG